MRWALANIAIVFTSLAFGDQLQRPATGPPEKILAGVSLDSGLAAIRAAYGTPTSTKGSISCWKRPGYSLCAEVLSGSQYLNHTFVQALWVECEAGAHSKQPRTGRGLKLGDTIESATRLYGDHYGDLAPYGLSGIEFHWEQDYDLRIETSRSGRIRKITVIAPD